MKGKRRNQRLSMEVWLGGRQPEQRLRRVNKFTRLAGNENRQRVRIGIRRQRLHINMLHITHLLSRYRRGVAGGDRLCLPFISAEQRIIHPCTQRVVGRIFNALRGFAQLTKLCQMLDPAQQRDNNQHDNQQRDKKQHRPPFSAVRTHAQRNDAHQTVEKRADKRCQYILRGAVFHQQSGGSRRNAAAGRIVGRHHNIE